MHAVAVPLEGTERAAARERRAFLVAGVVQGVGFRPHVHRLALELGLCGYVANDAAGVAIEVEGTRLALERFAEELVGRAPPLAVVDRLEVRHLAPTGEAAFSILDSRREAPARTVVPPDVATCDACLAELFDPRDRRYRYPFVNCTDCGPRFTIITGLPYDRARTTMAGFAMCERCAAEYADPSDRRFHAEPVACPECGPRLWFEAAGGSGQRPGRSGGSGGSGGSGHRPGRPDPARGASDAALAAAQRALAEGAIVAVKGIGGYHLACDARNAEAVARLRSRKGRGDKPFAVMAPGLDAALRLADLTRAEASALRSRERPIVLVPHRAGAGLGVATAVAPGNHRLGLLLPYSPLHHLLFAAVPGAGAEPPALLVMTSGNASEEPIAHEDADARLRLARLADGFLLHDRPIHVPCDDSVVVLDGADVLPLRRSRGYAPLPVRLPLAVPPLLAAGAELKNTTCLASGSDAFISQHAGDLGTLEALRAVNAGVQGLRQLYEIEPRLVAADRHPGYHSRRLAEGWALQETLPVELVQHHHAHVAALMAEHGLPADRRVVGVAFDGTGFGEDGAIWGGEILVAGYEQAERVAHLAYMPLPGGDSALRKPYRVALSFLHAAGIEWSAELEPVRAAPAGEIEALRSQLEHGLACVPTSSMGRLFDAVASLAGLCHVATYEAEAAIRLEGAARAPERGELAAIPAGGRPYRFGLAGGSVDAAPLLAAIVADLRAGVSATSVARRFHDAVAAMVAEVASSVARREGLEEVALTGGVFQNLLLLDCCRVALAVCGLTVLTHRLVPPNDGGLALGQAVVAGARRAAEQAVGR